ncbi:hypothetical protein KI688_011005 [Linnemannia hyalina]|uniref:Prolyl 4-hydroxylase alpha subunit domain-containing protein n=1 Tax=Linnemannia hyalina TaxID=64524 RepID=A0A9P7XY52_9FUNG|nr:hypothetical protein KI688_011005 [Linnemannia hyalina]
MSRKLQYQPLAQKDDTHPLRSILHPSRTEYILAQTPPVPTYLDLKPLLSKSRQSETITALTLSNVLTPQECDAMIQRTESLGYDIALVNVGGTGAGAGAGVHMPGYRDGKRCIVDDVQFAKDVWERVKAYIPPVWEGRPVVGMNERLRFLKYFPGDQFAPHMDGEYRRTDGSGDVTKITIQFYLNGGEKDGDDGLLGGETSFLSERSFGRLPGAGSMTKGEEKEVERIAVACRTGQALIFQHDLIHEGSRVIEGVKYVVRGDILYGPRPTPLR